MMNSKNIQSSSTIHFTMGHSSYMQEDSAVRSLETHTIWLSNLSLGLK